MRFASPLYLFLLLPLAALAWLEFRKKTGAIRWPDVSYFKAHPGRGAYYRPVLLGLNLAALLLMVLALARPQRGRVYEETEAKGVDIMLCLDVSETMLSPDFSPDRITVAKQRAKEFIEHRPGDRFGLVIFGINSMV
ncbi:MAG TPA: VWA domain-containing protein, partial [Candidatus Edwardsbacteria bacterium]|nr:VWA domain-containing protein [Candidatus Edwardsbacteria bacterium]